MAYIVFGERSFGGDTAGPRGSPSNRSLPPLYILASLNVKHVRKSGLIREGVNIKDLLFADMSPFRHKNIFHFLKQQQ